MRSLSHSPRRCSSKVTTGRNSPQPWDGSLSISSNVLQDHPPHFSGSRSCLNCQRSHVRTDDNIRLTYFWLGYLSRSWGLGGIDSSHPDGNVLLIAVGKNRRRRSQESNIFDRKSSLFCDFSLSADLEAFAMFQVSARMGDKT
jgi:hypothetical protein